MKSKRDQSGWMQYSCYLFQLYCEVSSTVHYSFAFLIGLTDRWSQICPLRVLPPPPHRQFEPKDEGVAISVWSSACGDLLAYAAILSGLGKKGKPVNVCYEQTSGWKDKVILHTSTCFKKFNKGITSYNVTKWASSVGLPANAWNFPTGQRGPNDLPSGHRNIHTISPSRPGQFSLIGRQYCTCMAPLRHGKKCWDMQSWKCPCSDQLILEPQTMAPCKNQ